MYSNIAPKPRGTSLYVGTAIFGWGWFLWPGEREIRRWVVHHVNPDHRRRGRWEKHKYSDVTPHITRSIQLFGILLGRYVLANLHRNKFAYKFHAVFIEMRVSSWPSEKTSISRGMSCPVCSSTAYCEEVTYSSRTLIGNWDFPFIAMSFYFLHSGRDRRTTLNEILCSTFSANKIIPSSCVV